MYSYLSLIFTIIDLITEAGAKTKVIRGSIGYRVSAGKSARTNIKDNRTNERVDDRLVVRTTDSENKPAHMMEEGLLKGYLLSKPSSRSYQ